MAQCGVSEVFQGLGASLCQAPALGTLMIPVIGVFASTLVVGDLVTWREFGSPCPGGVVAGADGHAGRVSATPGRGANGTWPVTTDAEDAMNAEAERLEASDPLDL